MERQITVGGWTFDIHEWGEAGGPAVLALHGFPQSPWSWEGVGRRLAERGVRVVAPAQRGYSPGARPTDPSEYAMPHIAADTLGLCDELFDEDTEVHLLGHDWGAAAGWWLAATHPGRFRSYTALSVPHTRIFNEAMRSDPDQQQKSSYFLLFRQEGKAEDVLLADDARKLRELFGDDIAPEIVDRHLGVVGDREALTGALNWYRAMSSADARIDDVALPVTYVWGAQDPALGRGAAERCGEGIAESHRGDYRFVELDDAGHWLPETHPGLVVDEVLARV